jgi:hypothetical protein
MVFMEPAKIAVRRRTPTTQSDLHGIVLGLCQRGAEFCGVADFGYCNKIERHPLDSIFYLDVHSKQPGQ